MLLNSDNTFDRNASNNNYTSTIYWNKQTLSGPKDTQWNYGDAVKLPLL